MKGLIILDNFILYTTDDGLSNVKLYAQDGTVWLTQKGMSELFSVKTQAITKHINNIYSEGELLQESTCSKMEQVQIEGFRQTKRLIKVLTLKFWQESTDALLSSHGIPLLNGKGKISHRSMVEHVHHLYDEFDNRRKHIEAKEADKLDMLEAEIVAIK